MEGSAIRPARLFCHCDAEGKRGRISRIMKTTTLASIHSVNRRAYQRILLLIPLVLAYFALSPQARATCQEGCFTTNNTVLGENALLNNTGSNNTGIGFNALQSNTTGGSNTANGFCALCFNTTGFNNTANGSGALSYNTTGGNNTANGFYALINNTTGSNNIALCASAGGNLTTGNNNIDI